MQPHNHSCPDIHSNRSTTRPSLRRKVCLTLLIVCTGVLSVSVAAQDLQECGMLAAESLTQGGSKCLVSCEKTRTASQRNPQAAVSLQFYHQRRWRWLVDEMVNEATALQKLLMEEAAARPIYPHVSPTAIRYRLPKARAQSREMEIAIDRSTPQTRSSAAKLLASCLVKTYFKWQQNTMFWKDLAGYVFQDWGGGE